MKRLLILSGKGGTGKTTVSAALLALSGAKAMADCDVDAPNLHLVLHQTSAPEQTDFMGGEKAAVNQSACTGCGACAAHCRFDAIQLKDGHATVNELNCEGCGVCGLVCPADAVHLHADRAGVKTLYRGEGVFSTATLRMGRGNSGKLVSEVKQAMLNAAPDCDCAIIDGSPGIGCPVMASASGMDLILIVAEASESGISDCERLLQTLARFPARIALCMNKCDPATPQAQALQALCQKNDIAFVGSIPFDKAAITAVNAGQTLADLDCPASTAVRGIYQSVFALLQTI